MTAAQVSTSPPLQAAALGFTPGSPALGAWVEGLALTYAGGVHALRDVSLRVPAGQHLAVLGASGSGKTSLLGCLSRRLAPTAGRVGAAGRVAVIYQDLRLVKERTALENVLYGSVGRIPAWRTLCGSRGLPGFPAAERRRAAALLERVGMDPRAGHRVSQLSGGERQRVAIARALMQDPAVLLADEPVASLDENNAHRVMELFTGLARERGLTIVAVLHDCALAERFFDRIVGLDAGRVAYDAPAGHSPSFVPSAPCIPCGAIAAHSAVARLGPDGRPIASDADADAAPSAPRWRKPLLWTAAIAAPALVYGWAISGLEIGPRQLEGAGRGLARFARDLWPHSWAQVASLPWGEVAWSLVQTMQMALLGTTLGVLVSLPLAALAAENVGPRWVRPGARFLLNLIRTVPSLIWALLFVAALGLGTFAGVMALAAYSVGYLTKFFYEGFEAVDPGPPAALAEIGATGPQRFLYAVWPAARPAALSASMFMFEYNVRAASVLGLVGAGGIGFWIMQFYEFRNFPALIGCLAMLLIVVVALDAISSRLRARLVRA